jgi:hypothetical protein
MPFLEMRTAKVTSPKECDEWVSELPSRIEWCPSGGVAPAPFDRLFQAALGLPILIQRGTEECQIKNQAYGFHLGGRCAP